MTSLPLPVLDTHANLLTLKCVDNQAHIYEVNFVNSNGGQSNSQVQNVVTDQGEQSPNSIALPTNSAQSNSELPMTISAEIEPDSNICSSPESGFGSEHPSSPRAASQPMAETVLPEIVSEYTSSPQTVDTKPIVDTTAKQCLPQIISVTSLAIAEEASDDLVVSKIESEVKCKDEPPVANESPKLAPFARYLQVKYNERDRKSSLRLKLEGSAKTVTKGNFVEHAPNAESQTKILSRLKGCGNTDRHVLFGLPALTCCRHMATKLTGYPGENTTAEDADFKALIDENDGHCSVKNTTVETTQSKSPKLSQRSHKSPKIGLETRPLTKLHISTVSVPSVTPPSPPKKAAKNTEKHLSNAGKTSSEDIFKVPCAAKRKSSEKTATQALQAKVSDPKRSKIERLKQILRKKEEDLEKVRRSCGFIS